MAIFAATELDRFAADILEARGVSSVFASSTVGETATSTKDVQTPETVSVPRVA